MCHFTTGETYVSQRDIFPRPPEGMDNFREQHDYDFYECYFLLVFAVVHNLQPLLIGFKSILLIGKYGIYDHRLFGELLMIMVQIIVFFCICCADTHQSLHFN